MRSALTIGLILINSAVFASDRITTVGKAELNCPANLSCTLTFSEGEGLLVKAKAEALKKFEAQCKKEFHRVVLPLNTESKEECTQTKSSASCSVVMKNDCNLEYADPYGI